MIRQLFDFIQCSPTASHTAATVRAMLVQAGFEELSETQAWDLQPGGKYFTVRGVSALIAFQVPKREFTAFSVVAPHGDSPCFKVKESPDIQVEGHYTKLNTEVYGDRCEDGVVRHSPGSADDSRSGDPHEPHGQ